MNEVATPTSTPAAPSNSILSTNVDPTGAPPVTAGERVQVIDEKKAFDWRDHLADDFKQDPSLNVFKDVNDLAKSYVSTKKMIGADKISLPGKYATDDEWKQVFHKLGLPDDPSKYELKPKEGDVNDELFARFKETAYQSGVLPKQAQSIYDWFQKSTEDIQAKIQLEEQKRVDQGLQELKKEWGDNFKLELDKAKVAIKHFGGEEGFSYVETSGLGNDVQFIKLMSKVGNVLSEDTFKGITESLGGMTPRDIESKRAAIFSDPAYFDKQHPGHDALVQEMLKLTKLSMG
jgi:hypothetical protein